jgi:hypothetical protein
VTQSKKPSPRDPSSAYARMAPKWDLADSLLGGTDALRAKAQTYLPRHENESQRNYNNRLARATLVNLFEDTLDSVSGRPFAEDIVLGEDVPPAVEEMLEDCDLQGLAIQPFARNWFRMGWGKGLAHVLVDFPTKNTVYDATGAERPRTLADDRAENLRPYLVLIQPENLLAAYSEMVNGKEELVHIRILEVSVERVGWEEKTVERVKVLERGTWKTYIHDEAKKDWVEEGNGTTGLPKIPLVTFYAGKRVGLHECKPPLHDLAHLNIAHWQSASDQRNVLTVARFPILAASGYTPETTTGPDGSQVAKVDIGPNNYLTTEDAQGKWYYVEHTGAAIEAGRNDLKDLELQMSAYGGELMREQPGGETATGRALDTAEATSYLAATVQEFKDCLEQVLQLMADWTGIEKGGTLELKGDFTLTETEATELDSLIKMRATRDISRVALLDEMKRRKVLCDDFDAEADKELLDEEGDDLGMVPPGGAVLPGQPPQPGLPAPAKPPAPPAEE